METPDSIDQLQQAIAGLTYTSEITAPFKVIQWDGPNPKDLKALVRGPANQPLETVSLDQFFHAHTQVQDWHSEAERDRAQRFQALVALLKQQLQDIRVFKTGKTEKMVYIVGYWSSDGSPMGITTTIVET
ncbi:MAG: nuclease A inhibitor family protein [Elainellaceae cyanobacterium]